MTYPLALHQLSEVNDYNPGASHGDRSCAALRKIQRIPKLILEQALGIILAAIAGLDVFLLQSMATAAKATSSLSDDAVFLSELSIALYLLPTMFGGIGINLVSHVLLRHLEKAERAFEREHPKT